MENQQEDLVPEEGFIEERNVDNSKKFTCKQCDKTFKQKQGVKSHIVSLHKNQGIKRTSSKTDNYSKKANKKLIQDDDMYTFEDEDTPEPVTESTHLDPLESTESLDNFAALHEDGEKTVGPDDTLDKIVGGSDILDNLDNNLDNNDDTMNETMPAEQECYQNDDAEKDFEMLRATNISLKLALMKKESIINDQNIELESVQVELAEASIKALDLKKEIEEKNESLDTATAQINSLEEGKNAAETKLKSYRATLRKMIKEKDENKSDQKSNATTKEKEMASTIKDKNKKIRDAETAHKNLASRIAELEENVKENTNSAESKLKIANNQLSVKTKDAKKALEDLRKSEKRSKDLSDTVAKLNKKVSELENSNIRLNLIKEHAKEVINKDEKKPAESKAKEAKTKLRCRYENTGNCRSNIKCLDVHPRTTCQSHSKLGSCVSEAICDHRHPHGICYDWQQFGTCRNGDSCRNRHPFELARQSNLKSPERPFLGHGPAGADPRAGGQDCGVEQDHWGGDSGRWSPSKVQHQYHDQRLGRW